MLLISRTLTSKWETDHTGAIDSYFCWFYREDLFGFWNEMVAFFFSYMKHTNLGIKDFVLGLVSNWLLGFNEFK